MKFDIKFKYGKEVYEFINDKCITLIDISIFSPKTNNASILSFYIFRPRLIDCSTINVRNIQFDCICNNSLVLFKREKDLCKVIMKEDI